MENMNQEREGRILEAAVETWGAEAQIIVAIEEMSELIKALTKYLRYYHVPGKVDCEQIEADVREEMADVSIMLNQLALIFGDPVEDEILKLLRLEQCIEAEKG